jgi:hypothetical protein
MKKLIVPLGIGIALFVVAGSAALAAPAATPAPLPAFLAAEAPAPAPAVLFGAPLATPADICSLPRYFCQACPETVTPERLCSERLCGTVVVVNCGDCAPSCVLPPA